VREATYTDVKRELLATSGVPPPGDSSPTYWWLGAARIVVSRIHSYSSSTMSGLSELKSASWFERAIA
jgi:hypothetical protein